VLFILKRIALGIALILGLLLFIAGCQLIRNSQGLSLPPAAEQVLRVATYNVHYIRLNKKTGKWGTDHWEQRKQPLDAVFKSLNADIVAFQEMESFSRGSQDNNNLTRSWLTANNPEFSVAAIGPWRSFPSTQPMFFRHDRLEVLDQGWFFFSETPDEIYSHTFNGSYPAFASWVQFQDIASSRAFYVINVHLDFSSRENRQRSVALTVERVKPWIDQGQVVLLLGDLNARLGSTLHKSLQAAGFNFAPITGSTYHFNRGINLFGAIDHIAHTSNIKRAGDPVVVREKYGRTWATDHYPVVVDFQLAE